MAESETEKKEEETYEIRSVEELEDLALEQRCELVVADSSQLLIDIDYPISLSEWQTRHQTALKMIDEKFSGIRSTEHWHSRSGNSHFQVTLGQDGWQPHTLIALQAALGSDSSREILSTWEHIVDPQRAVRCLFRPLR